MKKVMLAMAIGGLSLPASATTLTVGMDLSLSNPLVKDKTFTQQAATYVSDHVAALKRGDTVRIKSFGARDNAANLTSKSLTIKRHGAKKAAKAVAQAVYDISQNADNAQTSTNIVAWLEFNDFDCANGGKIIVLTDGIEASSYVSPNDLLEGKKGLPEPDEYTELSGCDVTFYGLGVGWQAQHVKHIRKAWREYFEKANATFTAVIQ